MSKSQTRQPIAIDDPNRLIALPEVKVLVCCGHTKIYQDMAKGEFPLPIRRGRKWTRWVYGEVIDHLKKLRAQRDAA